MQLTEKHFKASEELVIFRFCSMFPLDMPESGLFASNTLQVSLNTSNRYSFTLHEHAQEMSATFPAPVPPEQDITLIVAVPLVVIFLIFVAVLVTVLMYKRYQKKRDRLIRGIELGPWTHSKRLLRKSGWMPMTSIIGLDSEQYKFIIKDNGVVYDVETMQKIDNLTTQMGLCHEISTAIAFHNKSLINSFATELDRISTRHQENPKEIQEKVHFKQSCYLVNRAI